MVGEELSDSEGKEEVGGSSGVRGEGEGGISGGGRRRLREGEQGNATRGRRRGAG